MSPLVRLCCALAALALGAAIYTNVVPPGAYAQGGATPTPSPTPTPTGITVNSLSDTAVNDGLCTLREAITSANTNTASGAAPGECAAGGALDSIRFSVTGTILLTTPLPNMTTALALIGPGARLLTVSGNNTTRVFFVTDTAEVYLSGLTISGGRANGAAGIANGGTLTINECAITDNHSTASAGGISNCGTLRIGHSTISNNTAVDHAGGIMSGSCGGGSVVLTNTTVSSNSAAIGGGISNAHLFTMRYSTVTANSATTMGGGVYNPGIGVLTFGNTIIAGNSAASGPDGSGANFNSEDYNLVGNTSGLSIVGTTTHNITGVSADLGPLADNGGATRTHRPLYTSPAVDKGKSVNAGFGVLDDQRRLARPLNFTEVADAAGGDGSDIGAVELQGDDQPESSHQPFVVNSKADTDDGSCDALGAGAGNQDCTLREALNAANALAGADAVNFDPTVFAAPGPHAVELTATLPVISTSVTVNGPGAGVLTVRRSTAGFYRLLFITATPVRVSGMTLTNGRAPDGADAAGGALANSGVTTLTGVRVTGNRSGDGIAGSPFGGAGGGAYNTGTLTLVNSLVGGNTTGDGLTASGVGQGGWGGGIYSSGRLTLTNSLVNGNATGTGPDAGGSGGGVYASGTATLTNTTVSNNTTGEGGFHPSAGGGVYANGLTLTLTNSTITGNTSKTGFNHGVAVGPAQASISVGNTIIARNGPGTQSDLTAFSHTYTSRGHNIIGVVDSGDAVFIDGVNGDRVGTPAAPFNPLLSALGDYGGPTQTFALLPGSPAIDAGSSAGAPAQDQRGVGRVGAVDIGAFESRGFSVAATAGTPQNATIFTAFGMPMSATVTSAFGEPTSGGLVTFSAPASGASGTFAASATVGINSGGVATAPAFTANGTAGSYNVTASANSYSATFALTNLKGDQAITFGALADKTFGDAPFTVSATGGASGNPVVFGSETPAACSASGNTVTILAAGECTIKASQDGNGNYNAAPDIRRTFQIAKAGQTITFNALDDRTFGASDFTVSATATSGLAVSFAAAGNCSVTGNTVHLTGAGSCTITASQAGDANHFAAADVDRPFQVAKASTQTSVTSSDNPSGVGQGVTYTATVTSAGVRPAGVVRFLADGAPYGPSGVPCEPGAGDTCTAELTATPLPAGSHAVTAEYLGNADFLPSAGTLAGGQTVVAGGVFAFAQSVYTVGERGGSVTVRVVRHGETTSPASVDYATDDGGDPAVFVPCAAAAGAALDRCDYELALGTLHFAAGERERGFTVLVNDDSHVEGAETALLHLSNPAGGAALASTPTATLEITDDAPESVGNPLDEDEAFVAQHYRDFLNRAPDAAGLKFWADGIKACGADGQCREVKRIHTSAAFFLSIEFQNTGYLVERMHKAAYGDAIGTTTIAGTSSSIPVPVIRRAEFLADAAAIREGVVVNEGDWEQRLEANKNSFALAFVQRQRFKDAYPVSLTPAAFVAALNQNTGGSLTQAEADALAAEFGGAADTADAAKRASVFRKVAENAEFDRRERNRAFVLMQFFGYLQRDPNAPPDADHTGWKFWLDKLNQFDGNFVRAEMVKAFISSDEYRKRFGQ